MAGNEKGEIKWKLSERSCESLLEWYKKEHNQKEYSDNFHYKVKNF